MKKIIASLLLLPTLSIAAFVPGDGSLDLTCSAIHLDSKPYNIFELTFMYDDEAEFDLFDLISDSNLALGNGSVVYKVEVFQTPDFTADIPALKQDVKGCQSAPIRITSDDKNNTMSLSFECDGDGDAGFGDLTVDLESGEMKGLISFPEGKHDLLYPIVEDIDIEVSCQYTNF